MTLNVRIKYNDNDEELFCTYSKERIQLGEKYAILLTQLYSGEVESLVYKLENLPAEDEYQDFEDDEEPFISPT
jgi:hypothetical protein